MFAVPAPSGLAAYLIFPNYTNETSLESVQFDLKSQIGAVLQLVRDGHVVALAQVTGLTVEHPDDCTAWPLAQLASLSGAAPPGSWTVGVDPKVTTLRVDSLAGLTTKDSVKLTVALAQLSSALPGDTAIAFRGRPFVVRQASQFTDGVNSLIFAEIVRSVSQEAMPLQEHLLIIAQAERTERAGYRMQYFERAISLEDAAETTELLAIVHTDVGGLFALVSRDLGDGVMYGLIERFANGKWQLRWASAYAGC
jgi:hypothetical protein